MAAPKHDGIITLYDIPLERGGVCWSPNVWRIRLALNYKGLPYKTEWVEYPDIRKVGPEIGAPPTTPAPDGSGEMLWTCPMLTDSNNLTADGKPTVLADSLPIAKYLDKTYPEKPVLPAGSEEELSKWSSLVGSNVIMKLVPLLFPLCPDALAPRAREYFIETRTKWWGPPDQMCPDRPKAWLGVKEGLNKVAAALDADGRDGLTVTPGRVWYADFAIIAPLLWAQALISKEELADLRSWNDGRWGKLLDKHAELAYVQ